MAAHESAELEITITAHLSGGYRIELSYCAPDSKVSFQPGKSEGAVNFDLSMLRAYELNNNIDEYSTLLSNNFFKDHNIRSGFVLAQSLSRAQQVHLRIRLKIRDALELHALQWEALRDPENSGYLFNGERFSFSRYVESRDSRLITTRTRSELRALVVVTNPKNLEQYRLASINVSNELIRISKALNPESTLSAPQTNLVADDENKIYVTLEAIYQKLRDGYDILYIISHGKLVDGTPFLLFENSSGNVEWISSSEFTQRINNLLQPPRLIVLASCYSGHQSEEVLKNDEDSFGALGPLLAEGGIPAVIGMYGQISVETVEAFSPKFFEELFSHGQIDRAMAEARGIIRGSNDWWMPKLFMRIDEGRIWWHEPGFTTDVRQDFNKFEVIANDIEKSRCTPVLGFGIIENVFGTRYEMARALAETTPFLLHEHHESDLPQVVQYLSITYKRQFVLDKLDDYFRHQICSRYKHLIHKDPLARSYLLEDLISDVGHALRESNDMDPHLILARLPITTYVTSNPDSFLEDSLTSLGKKPHVRLCLWKRQLVDYIEILRKKRHELTARIATATDNGKEAWQNELTLIDRRLSLLISDHEPTIEEPLVFHLFGHLSERGGKVQLGDEFVHLEDSLVLSEDDYFRFLIGIERYKNYIPEVVRSGLGNALLLLGFHIDDWDFRALLTALIDRESRRKGLTHVAVQVNPQHNRYRDIELVQSYLREYYLSNAQADIYWGTAEDFLKKLRLSPSMERLLSSSVIN